VGVLYVLDEPSVGLHPRDIARLIKTLGTLRDRGNTVLVVEHDAETIAAADYVVDMGPAAGRLGGQVTACGTPREIETQPGSLTGQYLCGRRGIRLPSKRRPISARALLLQHATTNNLRDVTVTFPLGVLTCVAGVSGSGKSSLVMDTLLPAVKQRLGRGRAVAPAHATVSGVEQLDAVIPVDQAPIGRTPRSNPATYTGVLAAIRDLYAALPESRARGYTAARFSYNVKGGRCEACRGEGVLRVEMSFLPDVYVRCEVCEGKRYNRETLEITYRGRNIAALLALTADEAHEALAVNPKIRDQLAALRAVGLGYLELGQSATTLSGGEAQRLKLSKELARRATGKTLYILDEPTTGLHFRDIEILMEVLGGLVDAGNTVVIIEHNIDVIKLADHVIDLGPEGGPQGGRVIAYGTPEHVAQVEGSFTGAYLKRALNRRD
jgi:excinuclease ABC subunit A